MGQEDKKNRALSRGVENIYPSRAALEKELESGRRLRLYCGYDPTAPALHIGHAITLKKLAQFQDLGHEVIMLLGDFTGMIGDPTDKKATRKRLTRQEVLKNAKNYKKLAAKILKFSGKNPAKIMYNSQWLDKLTFADLIEISSNFTVGQMIVRDMFQERIKAKKPIYLHEFFYPLAQAYDSLSLGVDLEVGGNDQTFNMLCGRDLIKALKKKEKFVLTTKLLTDPLGQKMGKSEGNMVALDAMPNGMYGQIMSWPDQLIAPAMELATDITESEVEQIRELIKSGKMNPRDAKAQLARELVSIYHSKKAAEKAEKEFNRVFKKKDKPSNIPVFKLTKSRYQITDLLVKIKLAPSKSEARRLISQGAVRVDKKIVGDWDREIIIKDGLTVQSGKRNFAKIKKAS